MMERAASFAVSDFPPLSAESANALTHGFGWALSLVGSVALMRSALHQTDSLATAGCAVYVMSLVSLYGASTLSHSVSDPDRKNLFRMVDQICIFLLIAGSYTPFAMSHLRTVGGWSLLGCIWMLAFAGIAARVRSGNQPIAFFWYLPIAWLPVLILGDVLTVTGPTGLAYVIAGGLAYMSGLWFFVNDHKHPYFHAVWHCCVILGSSLHFLFHYQFLAA